MQRKWIVSHRYNYFAVDEYSKDVSPTNSGERCERVVAIQLTKKQAITLADACDNAYQSGRRDEKKEQVESTEHSGWSNYATFSLAVMIDNSFPLYSLAMNMATGYLGQEGATSLLAAEMSSHFEGEIPEILSDIWTALIGAALASVNWQELARHYLDKAGEQVEMELSSYTQA